MKEQNLKELLIDLKDFMDQVQSPRTPSIFLKRDIENYLLQMESEIIYKEVSFKKEKPDSITFLNTSGRFIYENGQVRCVHSGILNPEVDTWLKRIK